MATCLIALGSNLGDREATLEAAVRELDAIPCSRLVRASPLHSYPPIGGPTDQSDFLNAVALITTGLEPEELFKHLLTIEIGLGRERTQRWAARMLDLDLLLYEELVLETSDLIVPHPRMSFRRFVLEPAAEVAPDMIVPTIGWSIRQLLDQLNSSNDLLAVLSTSHAARGDVSQMITSRFGGRVVGSRVDSESWPPKHTSWISFAGDGPTEVESPKLTVILETRSHADSMKWRSVGRGPTLHLRASDKATIEQETSAAIESVWPDLGPARTVRIE